MSVMQLELTAGFIVSLQHCAEFQSLIRELFGEFKEQMRIAEAGLWIQLE